MGRHRAPRVAVWQRYRKFIVAAGNAALVALFAVWGDGISPEDMKYIVTSTLAALGVYATPNAPNEEVTVNDVGVQ